MTKKLSWKEKKHSVGHLEMDDQHRILFSIINDLFANDGDSVKSNIEVLNELIDYSNIHFSSEEMMLNDIGYAERFDHVLLHDEYNKRLVYFLEHIDEIETAEIYAFAKKWWINHILLEDMKYKNN